MLKTCVLVAIPAVSFTYSTPKLKKIPKKQTTICRDLAWVWWLKSVSVFFFNF